MLTLNVSAEGKTSSDLAEALREVLRLVGQGYLSGRNENETGEYSFSVSGDEESHDYLKCDDCEQTITRDEADEQELEEGSDCPHCGEGSSLRRVE